ncbi:MAG TPA: transporter substrate-binding domain-containing protein [Ensifer sp.]|nr:transporter substrate-binding domain-containing protein [Ensifer sp.]
MILWPSMYAPVAAADGQGPLLTFDKREHRAMPDISNVPRIRFLTTLDFPPFEFLDGEGRLSGFNVDLARELCETLNVTAKCQIQALPFNELQSALENGTGDAVIAGIGVTPDLRSKFDFSRPYLQLSARFLSLKKVAGEPITPMKLAAGKVGVVRDTAHQAMLKAYFPNVNPLLYDDRAALLKALKGGEIETAFGEGMALAFWAASGEAENCCAYRGGPYYSGDFLGEGMTIMTRPGEPLAAAFDHGLLELARSGKLNELFVKYFPPGLY